jgi:predicted PurR-regulated permease PerM
MSPKNASITIPRWIQLVGLPLLVIFVWKLATTVSHAVFVFVVAALVALLLNPMVRALGRIKIPRGIAVAIVYLSFAATMGLGLAALATVGVDRSRTLAERVNNYFTEQDKQKLTPAEHDVNRLQAWLDTHHLERVKIRKQGLELVRDVNAKKLTSRALGWIENAALSLAEILFSIVLVVVISIYMLLDMGRLGRALDRRFPPKRGSPPLLTQVELALASYIKGQALLSLIIGTSAGVGLWLLGTFGIFSGMKYAVFFGLWVAFTELIPYLGPWLGAIPPTAYALVSHPAEAIWVALLFLGIHQIEGHVVVPKVMGSALRLHPLLIIFGILAAAEIYGLLGVFVVLPLLATLRAIWGYFSDRVTFEPWSELEAVPIDPALEARLPATVEHSEEIGEAAPDVQPTEESSAPAAEE